MTRPRESDYTSHTSYTRALEAYCDKIEIALDFYKLAEPAQKPQEFTHDPAEIRRVFELDDAEMPPPESGFAKL